MAIENDVLRIAEASCREVFSAAGFYPQLEMSTPSILHLNNKTHFSVMTTVSTSLFRMVVLLHAPLMKNDSAILLPFMTIDEKLDVNRQYVDYISEDCNRLCGMCARHIQASGYSTGLSQPETLNRVYGEAELKAIAPTTIAHVQGTLNGEMALCASICLFVNENCTQTIVLRLEDPKVNEEISGELEFF